MSEIQKHIESCRAEDPLAQTMEACGNESDIQAALQPLLVETMQGYEPVPTTAPTSPIAELPGVLISIIRRIATKPLAILGDRPAKQSLLGSLVTTWNAIRQRLSGNPSAGIPDRRADMSGHSLPTALALLSARKITNGGSTTDGIPDGMSLAHILGDGSLVTEIKDDNGGWTMNNAFPWSLFPNLSKVTLGCEVADRQVIYGYPNISEFHMPNLRIIGSRPRKFSGNYIYLSGNVEHLVFDSLETWYIHRIESPSLKTITFKEHVHFYGVGEYESMFNTNQETLTVTFEKGSTYETTGYNSFLAGGSTNLKKFIAYGLEAVEANNGGCISGSYPALEEIILPDCERIVGYSPSLGSSNYVNLRKIQFGTIHSLAGYFTLQPNVNLIHFEFGDGTDCSLPLSSWSPTNALDASRTDLIEQGSTAENNLQQFLLNFRDYIALRLTDNGSGLTLTLSQAVRNAIHAAESTYGIENIIITQKGWTISPAPN